MKTAVLFVLKLFFIATYSIAVGFVAGYLYEQFIGYRLKRAIARMEADPAFARAA